MSNFLNDHSALILVIVILIIILVIYAVVAGNSKSSVIKSTPVKNLGEIEADMIYYLPTASVQVNASAKVIVLKDSTGTIVSAHLAEMALDNSVSLIPDTNFPFALRYQPNIFMNDELRLTTGTSGLLDTILTTTDDQLGNILKQVADAPAQILALKTADVGVPVVAPTHTTVTIPYSKTFHIRPDELLKEDADCPWLINTDGTVKAETNVNAGFKMAFHRPDGFREITPFEPTEKGGLFTRPLTTLKFKLILDDKKASGSTEQELQVVIPDSTRVIHIPVERSAFIKRINTPKFSSGMIMENYINVPSQFEGFISIPINIAKALISIPAALFNFTIHRKYDNQLADLAMQKKLLDAENLLKKPAPPGPDKKPGT